MVCLSMEGQWERKFAIKNESIAKNKMREKLVNLNLLILQTSRSLFMTVCCCVKCVWNGHPVHGLSCWQLVSALEDCYCCAVEIRSLGHYRRFGLPCRYRQAVIYWLPLFIAVTREGHCGLTALLHGALLLEILPPLSLSLFRRSLVICVMANCLLSDTGNAWGNLDHRQPAQLI